MKTFLWIFYIISLIGFMAAFIIQHNILLYVSAPLFIISSVAVEAVDPTPQAH